MFNVTKDQLGIISILALSFLCLVALVVPIILDSRKDKNEK